MSERNQQRGMHEVRAPLAGEGIGKALRGAYDAGAAPLPAEFMALLGRIS